MVTLLYLSLTDRAMSCRTQGYLAGGRGGALGWRGSRRLGLWHQNKGQREREREGGGHGQPYPKDDLLQVKVEEQVQ